MRGKKQLATGVGLLLAATITPPFSTAQTTASVQLLDVASFTNGAYPYIPSTEKQKNIHSREHVGHQLDGISRNGAYSNDLFYINDRSNQKSLYYVLATPAMIDSFRIRGEKRNSDENFPRRFEFSVSQSPGGDFRTVAAFNTPDSFIFGRDRFYDFSIPAGQKITGRYVRVIVSGFKHNSFWNFDFSAYGRFNQPVQSRTDFSGIYSLGPGGSIVSESDLDMVTRQKGTDYDSYLILQQKGTQIDGCYVHGKVKTEGDGSRNLDVISEVIGNLKGSVENNVFRFTRTSAKHHDRRHGAMAFAPAGEEIKTGENYGYLLVMKDLESESARVNEARENGFQAFSASVSSRIAAHTTATCAIAGKVQFDTVYFNFDSRALTSESKAALDRVVEAAKAYPEWKFEIGGHTDSIGSTEYNLKLSEHRAAAVMRYLVTKGVDAARLQAKGYGATRIFESNVHHFINRRVEVIQQ